MSTIRLNIVLIVEPACSVFKYNIYNSELYYLVDILS